MAHTSRLAPADWQLAALRARFASIRDEERPAYPDIDRDPFLTPPCPEGTDQGAPTNPNEELLLKRFLVAADLRVDEAAARLRKTVHWRRDWGVLEYYEHGAAERFMSEARSPGAEVYMGDSLSTDIGA
jgi:hypothetical protein